MCHVAWKFVRHKSWNTKNSVTMQPSLVQEYGLFSCPKLDVKISVQKMVRTYKAFQDIFKVPVAEIGGATLPNCFQRM